MIHLSGLPNMDLPCLSLILGSTTHPNELDYWINYALVLNDENLLVADQVIRIII